MKTLQQPSIVIILFLAIISACSSEPSLEELQKLAATETYPEDSFLDTVAHKKALIIVAHDDDDCAMSGTIYRLKQQGWVIEQWSFKTTPLAKGNDIHPAHIISEGNYPILNGGVYRRPNPYDSLLAPYMPIPKAHFKEVFEEEKVVAALRHKLQQFQPSVIFTLDNEIGGYGHPDHIFISQVVSDLFQQGETSAMRIYQSVYTNSMAREIVEIRLTKRLAKWGFPNSFLVAKEMYGVDGMPEPTTQVTIGDAAIGKMKYLRAYSEDAKKNMRKFIPHYEDFDTKTYFSVFDREFFRVLER